MGKLPGASVTPMVIEKHSPDAEPAFWIVILWLEPPILGKAERIRSAPPSDINLLGYPTTEIYDYAAHPQSGDSCQ